MPPRRGNQPYRRLGRNGQTSYGPRSNGHGPSTVSSGSLLASERTSLTEKFENVRLANRIDESMGFSRYDAGRPRIGWLVNMHSTTIEDEGTLGGRAGVDYYFIEEDGSTFKATIGYDPYFLIAVRKGREAEWVKRGFEGMVKSVKKLEKEDLSMPNHLLGYRRTLLKLSFANVSDLLGVRKIIIPIAEKNKSKVSAMDPYAEVAT